MQSVKNFYHDPALNEASNTVIFDLELPISKYVKDDTIPNELNLSYAIRDVSEAEDSAYVEILKRTNLPDVPLSINISASFKNIEGPSVIFEITVSGPNIRFINTVKSKF